MHKFPQVDHPDATGELKAVYDEHIEDNRSLLPHVLMGDVTRFVGGEGRSAPTPESTRALLDCLEEGLLCGGKDIKELILASFAENLIGEATTLRELRPLMGPTLRMAVDRICE